MHKILPTGTFADLELILARRVPEVPLCQPCSSMEFQPKTTESHLFQMPRCHHSRKLCAALDAVNVRKGSPAEDDVCMCPHYLDFRPVRLLDHDCLLFNSSSGCKCERSLCPKGMTMSGKGKSILLPGIFGRGGSIVNYRKVMKCLPPHRPSCLLLPPLSSKVNCIIVNVHFGSM